MTIESKLRSVVYGMPKWYLFNSQNIMQLSKYRSTFLNISCNSQSNMQLRKGVYFLGTCIMNSERLLVLWPGHALVVGKVAGKGENILIW